MSDTLNQQVNSQAQGIPSVTGRRKNGSSRGLALLGLAAIALLGAAFAWYALTRGHGEPEDKPQEAMKLTSSQTLTVPPAPPPEPEPLPRPVPEPEPEKVAAVPAEPVPAQLAALPAPLPAQDSQGQFDAEGNPIPPLEALKFAAPMMGMVGGSNTSNTRNNSRQQSTTASLSSNQSGGGELAEKLQAVNTPSSAASRINNQSYVLSKGTVIECILETRVDTTVPGMTTCVVPRDIYSMNGRMLLVEKGTKAIGEYQGAVQNGLARIFMLWTELRTPHGVSIRLNSPAADSLGGAGMGGYVDYHWWKRFGNALLFSMVADGFQFAINTANSNNNNGDVTYENTEDGMDEIVQEALRQSGNIPPTLIKNQGERVSIFVSRDLSFESVYGIKAYGNY